MEPKQPKKTTLKYWQQMMIKEAIQGAKMESAGFSIPFDKTVSINGGTPLAGLDETGEFTELVKEATKLYRETWIIPVLEALLDE